MNGWINFWGALLLVTLVIYGVLVIYVSIGGLRAVSYTHLRAQET